MKKLFLSLLLVVGLAVTTNVSAMTEDELLDKLTQSYTINGRTEKLDEGVVVQVKRYFEENEVSSDDCDFIAAQIDKAVALVEDSGATKWDELTGAQVKTLIGYVEEVSNKTSVKVSLSKDGVLTVYDKAGKVFTKVSKNKIQYTGSSAAIMVVAGTISLVGFLVITRKIVKA